MTQSKSPYLLGYFLTLLLISLTDNYPSHWQGMILVYGYFQGKYQIVFIIHAEIHICSVDYFYILIFIFKTEKFLFLFISKISIYQHTDYTLIFYFCSIYNIAQIRMFFGIQYWYFSFFVSLWPCFKPLKKNRGFSSIGSRGYSFPAKETFWRSVLFDKAVFPLKLD